MQAHQAARRLLRKRIQRQPARERVFGRLQLPATLLEGREPLEEEMQAHLPLLLLLLVPRIKAGVLAQPEAIEEGTTHQREGVLELHDQGGALLLRRDRREPQGLLPGLLHHVEVQLEGSLRGQAEQLTRTQQMAVRSRQGVGERATQQRQGVAQGPARIGWLAVGPQQRGELAAGVQALLDRQVEQQGLRLAQGKAEAGFVMKDFGRAEHGQT